MSIAHLEDLSGTLLGSPHGGLYCSIVTRLVAMAISVMGDFIQKKNISAG